MRILITGGCGFLGHYLVNELINKYKFIKVIDLKSNANFRVRKGIELVLGKDVTNYDSIKYEFKDIDLVIHLAGIVSFSVKDKQLLERVNVKGTHNVLRAAIENDVKNFIHISSVAALGYSDDQDNPIDEDFVFDWEIAELHHKYYMLTKHLADLEVEKARKKGIAVRILYPGLIFGPGDIKNSVHLLQAIHDHKVPFNMPGGTNIVDVRDVAKGIVKAANNIKSDDFLLSGENLTFSEINATIAKHLGVEPPKRTLPKKLNTPLYDIAYIFEILERKKIRLTSDNIDSAFKFRYFSNEKAKQFNWKPEISFDRTIEDTIKWMKEHDLLER